MRGDDMADTGWHLDKRVPISIIVVLVVQMLGGAWMVSKMHSDIASNTRDIARHERAIEVMTISSQEQAVQLGRIEESMSAMRGDIARLVRLLEGGMR